MKLAEMIAPEAVAVGVNAPSRRAALEQAAALLEGPTGLPAARLLESLAAREALGTTGFGAGTAVPHGRLEGLCGIHAALFSLCVPVEWESVDRQPVDLVLALVGPEAPGTEPLKALALASRALRDKPLVARLRGATTAHALWSLLAAAGARRAA
jgi:PTS system nitrogen regulatory IIA component